MTIHVNNNAVRTMALLAHPGKGGGAHPVHGPVPFGKQAGGIRINAGSGDDRINVWNPDHYEGHKGDKKPVAANEHGRIWNDPHFQGGDGGRFDIQGEAGKNYNLLSDTGLQLNGRFDEYGHNGTAVGKTGITVTGDDGQSSQVAFTKEGTATIDGRAMEQGREYTLTDGGTAVLDGKTLSVNTAEGYAIDQQAKSWLGDGFINIDMRTGDEGVGHGKMPGGLLGHTFDADSAARNGKTGHGAQGEGAIDGVVGDYEVGDIFAPPADEGAGTSGPIHVDGGSGDDTIIINGPVNGPVVVDGGSGDDVIIINGDFSDRGTVPPPQDPIAANEHGRIWGDPHFVGGDGGKYDVQGEVGKTYDLLSDTGLQLNGRFDAWRGGGATVVGETGMTVTGKDGRSSEINFKKDGTATINGEQMEQGKLYALADGGTAKLDGKTLTVTTGEGYTVKQQANGSHINLDVHTGDNGVATAASPADCWGRPSMPTTSPATEKEAPAPRVKEPLTVSCRTMKPRACLLPNPRKAVQPAVQS